ncbi:MAG TPA: ARMT1-like domain-containing protein [Syntrophorhabdaceae bacterium]|nr:ARMT1-like domain-containing protein [Syntrophorhabdaceae bacterium]
MTNKFYLLNETTMKVTEYCKNCLRELAEKTCYLSHAEKDVLWHCFEMIDELFGPDKTPPAIANKIHRFIRDATGVLDPYAEKKDREVSIAKKALFELNDLFIDSLEGVLKYSAIGNSTDTFIDGKINFLDEGSIAFYAELDNIEKELDKKEKDILILGDNVSDFLFDIKLINFLEGIGKNVFYAVKEGPVQNDLCMDDVFKYQFDRYFSNIISTGTHKVGIEKKDLKGKIKTLWERDATIIAKGMGNYETISEFQDGKKIIHIMKVKCPAVSAAISYPEGSYVAIVR